MFSSCDVTLIVLLVAFGAVICENSCMYSEVFSCVITDNVYNSIIDSLVVDSSVECSLRCSQKSDCAAIQISRLAPFTCILHNRTLQSQSCVEYPDTDLRGFNNMDVECLNGGYKQVNGCQCYYGYVGSRCEKIQKDCSEGYSSGSYGSGYIPLIIHPDDAPNPFIVLCWFLYPYGGRTMLMQRKDGVVDFNRPWADYKNGFGLPKTLNSEFWLGLDNIHYVTNTSYQKMIVEIKTRFPNDTYPWRQQKYIGFRVGNESDGYAFDYDSMIGMTGDHHLGDCLTPMKGKLFTTVDVDNDDLGGENCAQIHQGAWWFTGCGDCNPTGPMVKPTSGTLLGIPNEVFWLPGIPTYSITEIDMFVVPP